MKNTQSHGVSNNKLFNCGAAVIILDMKKQVPHHEDQGLYSKRFIIKAAISDTILRSFLAEELFQSFSEMVLTCSIGYFECQHIQTYFTVGGL